jgi:hypothetical protein
MSAMKELIDGLKARLRENRENYIDQNDWNGNTESGFYTTYDFDMNKLMEEIDAFAAEFEEKRKANRPTDQGAAGQEGGAA